MDDVGLFSGLLLCLLLGTLGVMGLQASSRPGEGDFQARLFLIGFSLRFAVAIALYQFGLVNVLKDEDASGWLVGRAFSEDWLREGATLFDLPAIFARSYGEHHKGYYYLVGILFHVTSSPTRLVAAALNCFFGALTAILCYRTARTLFSERVASQVGWWVCLYPSLIIWSAQTLKEPVVIFLEAVLIYACVCIQQKGFAFRHVLAIVAAIVLLVPFRFYAAYLGVATVALTFTLGNLLGGRLTVGSFVVSVVLTALMIFFALNLLGRESKDREIMSHYDLKSLETYRNNLAASGTSGIFIESDLQSADGFTVSVALGATYLLLAPFPWQLGGGSLRLLLVGPEVLLWYWLFITGVVPGITTMVRERLRDVFPLLIVVLGLGLLYSMTAGNVGLVYRQRAQLLPWLLIFAVVGREAARLRRTQDGPEQADSAQELAPSAA